MEVVGAERALELIVQASRDGVGGNVVTRIVLNGTNSSVLEHYLRIRRFSQITESLLEEETYYEA